MTFPLTMIAPAEMIESIIMQAIAKSNSSKSVRLNGEVKTYRSINNGIELQSNDNSNGKYENGNGYRCRLNGDEPSGFGLEDSTERVVIDYQLEAGEPSFFFRCCNRTILVAISTMISTYIPYFSMVSTEHFQLTLKILTISNVLLISYSYCANHCFFRSLRYLDASLFQSYLSFCHHFYTYE